MKMKQYKAKKGAWFVRVRGSYLPASLVGWLTYIPYTAYVVGVLIYVMSKRLDLWQSIFLVLPNWIAALVIMSWLAARKS